MSGFWLTPAAPGTISTAYLDKVRELHGIVRDWITRSAREKKNEHIAANLPYVDLMFAFGFATLGDHPTANKLVEDARKLLEVPIPKGGNALADENVTAAVVSNFLFKAFVYRISEVLRGRIHSGSLSPVVHTTLDEITLLSIQGPVNNPYKLALYAIDRFRNVFGLMEPEERIDPYFNWTRGELPEARAKLRSTHDPSRLTLHIRRLLQEGLPGCEPDEIRGFILSDCLSFAGRVGESFVIELLAMVPAALAVTFRSEDPSNSRRQVELLHTALVLCIRYGLEVEGTRLVREFAEGIQAQPEPTRLMLIRSVGKLCLQTLQQFGLREEVRRLVTEWNHSIFGNSPIAELRTRFQANMETWGIVLTGLQALAGGWLWLGDKEHAEPILSTARQELLNSSTRRLRAKEFTEVARAYIAAMGNDSSETGLAHVATLFCEIPTKAVTNTWKTAAFYSRFHLQLVEEAIATVCQLARQTPTAAIAK